MKWVFRAFALSILLPIAAGAQNRPTLHRSHETEYGPNTSSTTNAQMLARIHTIYLEPIGHDLSRTMAAGLKTLGWVRVVTSRSKADAVLSGTCFDARHLKIVHSEVYLNNRRSGAAIWEDEIRVPYGPPPLAQVVDQSARELVAHLQESVRKARGGR